MRGFNRAFRWLAGSAALAMLLSVGVATGQARDLVLPGLAGGALSEADFQEGTTIVIVWASWSPRSRDIVDRVNEIEARWGKQARVVTIDFQEDRGVVEGFLKGKNLAVPVYLDSRGAFSKKHSVTTLPGILIYADGELAHRGRLPSDANALIGRILG
jgi:thiol-disulfide isomerase/thioredoxin